MEENVISNIMRGCSVFEISGMTASSTVSAVKIWRPLLNHVKDEIFDFAHRYSVPYFKDTTPRWSTRGKLRNQLLPLLNSIYGKGFGNSLNSIAKQSDALHEEMEATLFTPFLEKVVHGKVGIVVDCDGYIQQPFYFWKYVLRRICHAAKITAIHEKPVRGLLDTFKRMQSNPSNMIWLELKADNRCFMYKRRHLVILRNQFIPSANSMPSFTDLDLKPGTGTRGVDCWIITATPTEAPIQREEIAISRKKTLDIVNFCISGELSYVIQGGSETGYRLWNCKETHESMQYFAKVPKKFSRAIPFILPKIENKESFVRITITFEVPQEEQKQSELPNS